MSRALEYQVKSSLTVPCSCGKQIPFEINGSQLPEYARCSDCGATIYLIDPLGNIVTMLLMARAKQELAHNDITIATLLSAVAVEAEMAYLFFKWKAIESQKVLASQTPEDKKHWEDEWVNMRSIGKRLDELSRLLTSKPFDEFACSNKILLQPAIADHNPATSMKDFLQQQFFDERNEIVHYGKIDFQEGDGERLVAIATALLNLLHAMDLKRIHTMDEAHKKAREEPSTAEM